MGEISERMNEYMVTRVGIAAAEVTRVREAYWSKYGTTLRGLYLERHIDPEAFLEYVHDIEVSKYLQPDAELDRVLNGLAPRKAIFTNASAGHARRVLTALGIARHFERIFDISFIDYESKPAPPGYRKVLAALDAPAAECAMIDDMARNLAPARALGIRTVLLDGRGVSESTEGVDRVISAIYEVSDALL